MSESWLEIQDQELDAQEVQRRVEDRLSQREADGLQACVELDLSFGREGSAPPAQSELSETVTRWLQDCDLVPAHYEINWRVPIVGPIHAAVRRLINAEIRRFLLPSLVKQSHLNRAVLRLLKELAQDNARLAQEAEQLRKELAELRCDQEQDR